jgi:hypothetical protein
MHQLRAVAFAIALAVPAIAQAADSVADQASRAFEIFAGGLSQPDFGTARYGRVLLAGIDGKWVSLNGPAPGTGIETYGPDRDKFCAGRAALTLGAPDPLTLSVTARPVEAEFTQTYTLISGSAFAERTDPASYFESIGLGADKVGPEMDQRRAVALSVANGTVHIFRPSDDILVIVRSGSYPTVLARCPS